MVALEGAVRLFRQLERYYKGTPMSETSMYIDAILLIIFSLCIVVVLSEDPHYQALIPRAIASFIGAFAFMQAMWLLGMWIPGASGFPLPRIGFDGMLAAMASYRAYGVLKLAAADRRRRPEHARGK